MILFEMFCIFVPVIDLLLWFFLGKNLVSTVEKPVLGWLLLNWVGILSLLLFVWQFALIPENQQIGAIAIFCQQFGAGLALLTFNIGALFQPGSNTIELQGALAMQISALIFMMGASLLGVGSRNCRIRLAKAGKKKRKPEKRPSVPGLRCRGNLPAAKRNECAYVYVHHCTRSDRGRPERIQPRIT